MPAAGAIPASWFRLCGALCLLSVVPLALGAYQLPMQTGRRAVFASDDDFLDYVQRQTFQYFWATQHPTTGLVPDRASNLEVCNVAAVGFGLSALNLAAERGWVPRASAAARVRTTLEFLLHAPQGPEASGRAGHRGWFYRFLDTSTGVRIWQSELSTIDTALLLLGVIDSGLYFDRANSDEAAIRHAAGALVARVDWLFMLRADQLLALGWSPEGGHLPIGWNGYSEAMALYLLGLGAAHAPLPPTAWRAWTSSYQWRIHHGQSYVWTPTGSLFTHQYSHCWIDFRGIADAHLRTHGGGLDYFENSRRATLAQQAHAALRPYANYSALEFGITACDGPAQEIAGVRYAGYEGRGAPPGAPLTLDDGTLAPTAVLGSLPFAPEACLPAARHLYETYREAIWSDYGFCDAYNITAGRWFAPDVIGISAGTNVLMIENLRTASVWRRLLRSPQIQRGLERAGFTAPPPDDVQARAVAARRIRVQWSEPAPWCLGIQVEVSTDEGATFAPVAVVAAQAGGADLAAQPGTRHLLRVRTWSAAGLSGWKQVLALTTPAESPSAVQLAGATPLWVAATAGTEHRTPPPAEPSPLRDLLAWLTPDWHARRGPRRWA